MNNTLRVFASFVFYASAPAGRRCLRRLAQRTQRAQRNAKVFWVCAKRSEDESMRVFASFVFYASAPAGGICDNIKEVKWL